MHGGAESSCRATPFVGPYKHELYTVTGINVVAWLQCCKPSSRPLLSVSGYTVTFEMLWGSPAQVRVLSATLTYLLGGPGAAGGGGPGRNPFHVWGLAAGVAASCRSPTGDVLLWDTVGGIALLEAGSRCLRRDTVGGIALRERLRDLRALTGCC